VAAPDPSTDSEPRPAPVRPGAVHPAPVRPLDPVEADRALRVLVICTGNAARSVMAGFMLERLAATRGADLAVATAGTHSVDGQPMSGRTRNALVSVDGLGEFPASRHRSRQMREVDVAHADVVLAMESDHVRYVRRHHPGAADRTVTLRRLVVDLAPPPPGLTERVAALGLGELPLDPTEDVLDPAGGDDDTYVRCAAELWELCTVLVDRLW
jgi:protein-tyrosine-phosphatase